MSKIFICSVTLPTPTRTANSPTWPITAENELQSGHSTQKPPCWASNEFWNRWRIWYLEESTCVLVVKVCCLLGFTEVRNCPPNQPSHSWKGDNMPTTTMSLRTSRFLTHNLTIQRLVSQGFCPQRVFMDHSQGHGQPPNCQQDPPHLSSVSVSPGNWCAS